MAFWWTLCGRCVGPVRGPRARWARPEAMEKRWKRFAEAETARNMQEKQLPGLWHTALILKPWFSLGISPWNVVRTLCRRCVDVVYDVVYGFLGDVVRTLCRACSLAPRPLGAPRSKGKAMEKVRRDRNGQKYAGKAAPGTLAYGPDPQTLVSLRNQPLERCADVV